MFNIVSARLYLALAELQPVDAPDEWFLPKKETPVTRVDEFLAGVADLQMRLTTEPELTEERIQWHFYEAAKSAFGEDKIAIRDFFRYLYIIMFRTQSGPRWGQFVIATGLDVFLEKLQYELRTL
jgi:lysyl-tRNA synthetase class I